MSDVPQQHGARLARQCLRTSRAITHHSQNQLEVTVDNILRTCRQLLAPQLDSPMLVSLTPRSRINWSALDAFCDQLHSLTEAHLSLLHSHDRLAGVSPQARLGHDFLSSVGAADAGKDIREAIVSTAVAE